ncbi:methionine synthase [Chloroflexota bacterium]
MTGKRFGLNGLATMIGSMPHRDAGAACSLVFKYLPDIPAWPQLPNRSPLENMYAQFSQFLDSLGVSMGTEGESIRIRVDTSDRGRLDEGLTDLFSKEVDNDVDFGRIEKDRAEGLYAFLAEAEKVRPAVVKGQVTGPISFGLMATDEKLRPLLYDDSIADVIAGQLKLVAAWQERVLRAISPDTIIFLDEPYLASVGSAFVSVPQERMQSLIEKVLEGITGLKGIHCCGNTDWSMLLKTSVDILNFDAYNYGQTLSLYPDEVKDFLNRGGVVAWGIVPSDEEALRSETVASIKDRLEETMGLLCRKGIEYDTLMNRCLLTPSCGLESVSIEAAEKALELLSGVSKEIRKYGGL